MLPRRLASSALHRSAFARSTPITSALIIPRRFYAAVQPGTPSPQDSEYLSVSKVAGVPIVSNYDVGEAHLHPDPEMTGGYVNPPAHKRQFNDPYATYWDQQERRNYGDPVNEDEDILGRFSPEVYTWTSPQMGLLQHALFILTVGGLCGAVYLTYPDKPAVPRTFPFDGLKEQLGGDKALPALSDSEA